MQAYVVLYKWTEKGISSVKQSPARIGQVKAALEKMGGRAVGVWVTMGEYDLVAIMEAPSDEVMAAFILAQTSMGTVTSRTLKAFSEEEFARIVSKLP